MHVIIEFVEAKPEHRAALRTTLLLRAHSVLDQKIGCHQFDISEDDLEDTSFLLYQVFENRAAYRSHLEMQEYAEHRLLVDRWIKTRRTLQYDLISEAGVA